MINRILDVILHKVRQIRSRFLLNLSSDWILLPLYDLLSRRFQEEETIWPWFWKVIRLYLWGTQGRSRFNNEIQYYCGVEESNHRLLCNFARWHAGYLSSNNAVYELLRAYIPVSVQTSKEYERPETTNLQWVLHCCPLLLYAD